MLTRKSITGAVIYAVLLIAGWVVTWAVTGRNTEVMVVFAISWCVGMALLWWARRGEEDW